jgi:hypothetical protein
MLLEDPENPGEVAVETASNFHPNIGTAYYQPRAQVLSLSAIWLYYKLLW